MINQFSGPVSVFQERPLPETATPAGYVALIDAYGLAVPLPRLLFATGGRHRTVEQDGWRVLTPRHAPPADLEGHLTFALKYEGLDLAVLKRLFLAIGPNPIEAIVRTSPTGRYARRIWFLYEWLIGATLNLPDAVRGNYVEAVDPERQYAARAVKSPRHRVNNNLPGTPEFCPLVSRTERLDKFIAMNFAERARAVVATVPAGLLARTAAFLLLEDSKSSYVIEGDRAPQHRIQRWGRAIGEAGRRPFNLDEILRLQRIVIGDVRFVRPGLRREDGFVGEYDRESRMPMPDHIGARPNDLASLVTGMTGFDRVAAEHLDPVIAAAVLAFGFVYVHPFADGNGRIHRYLIHHVLAHRGFNPPGVHFPVSAAMLARIDEYRGVLESHSRRLLPLIEWQPTESGNVRVMSDTGDYYRFFDATPHAEFLYACIQQTIDKDLPEETGFLERYDRFYAGLEALVDMPDDKINLLFRFLRQNGGRLSGRAREREFAALRDDEAQQIEAVYQDAFGRAE